MSRPIVIRHDQGHVVHDKLCDRVGEGRATEGGTIENAVAFPVPVVADDCTVGVRAG